MNNNTDEVGESLQGAAPVAGCGAGSTKLMQELNERMTMAINQVRNVMNQVDVVLKYGNPEWFEQFYNSLKQTYDESGVEQRFDKWLCENDTPTMLKLREFQALEVARMLQAGVLSMAPIPSQQEISEVKVDYLNQFLPCNFVMTQAFIVDCARWRRFIRWDGLVLIIDYPKYGKYLCSHLDNLTKAQLDTVFELDMMLMRIHREMGKLRPEEPEEQVAQSGSLVGKLMPIFYNDEAEVKCFLKEIVGAQPSYITDLVNRWVKEKRISDYGASRKGQLWQVLSEAGLYNKSRQNWNRRVY